MRTPRTMILSDLNYFIFHIVYSKKSFEYFRHIILNTEVLILIYRFIPVYDIILEVIKLPFFLIFPTRTRKEIKLFQTLLLILQMTFQRKHTFENCAMFLCMYNDFQWKTRVSDF